ncbi:MAG TPA: MFS transporter [Gemmataceae bacterium]|jgi:POT family proton-dependent oligopeptide transporter|nr:MFS transporter [Gemmataceae bacterium]
MGEPEPTVPSGRLSVGGLLTYLRRHPVGFWFIFWGELAERCAFYGVRTLLFVYLTKVLLFEKYQATSVSATYKAGCFLTPLLGGFLADRFFGKYWTIVAFSIPYVCGMLLLGVGTEYAVYGGLALLALGSGVIKPNISTLMGLTYDQRRPGEDRLRSDAFYVFYLAINIGSLVSSSLLPIVAKPDGYFGDRGFRVGFLITAGLMSLALVLFAAGKRYYAVEHVRNRTPITPTERAERWNVLSRLGGLFLLVTFWWFAYEMKDNIWVAFADQYIDLQVTETRSVQPNQLIALNPIFIIILVPTINLFWKAIDPTGQRFPAPRKMLVGFGLMILTYTLLSTAGFLATSTGSKSTVIWMVAAFISMTASEVMVSVVGLELAYRAAPQSMKGFITACWLFTTFLANFITVPVARLKPYDNLGPGPFFAGVAGLMVINAIVLWFVGRRLARPAD